MLQYYCNMTVIPNTHLLSLYTNKPHGIQDIRMIIYAHIEANLTDWSFCCLYSIIREFVVTDAVMRSCYDSINPCDAYGR